MSVVARFYVSESTKAAGMPEGARRVKMNAVCRGPENADWARWSPSGSIEMYIANPPAAEFFDSRVGKDVAITFEDRDPICERCNKEAADAKHWFDAEGVAHWAHGGADGEC